jgi:hypothetical protein
MKINRKPNFNCTICDKYIYKRKSELDKGRTFCSLKCAASNKKLQQSYCKICNKLFKPSTNKTIYCSHTCSNKSRKGKTYKNEKVRYNNKTDLNLKKLQDTFKFNNCMIENCTYNTLYNIHRLIEGKDGGKYEIGNMFAICPNHHAEIHKKIITVVKINNCTLKIVQS